jgi:hypothetical protein
MTAYISRQETDLVQANFPGAIDNGCPLTEIDAMNNSSCSNAELWLQEFNLSYSFS